MAETELNDIEVVQEPRPRRLRWDWLLPVFFCLGRTMHAVSQQEKGVWLAPLLVLSLLVLIVSLAGGPARADHFGRYLVQLQSSRCPTGHDQFLYFL